MRQLWFAYCSSDDYAVVQREIEQRERGACVLRIDDLTLLERLAMSFAGKVSGTMVLARGLGIETHATLVERMARVEGAGRVVVLVEDIDPARIAPLFYAGAVEVIPLEEVRVCRGAVASQQGERETMPSAPGPSPEDTSDLRMASALLHSSGEQRVTAVHSDRNACTGDASAQVAPMRAEGLEIVEAEDLDEPGPEPPLAARAATQHVEMSKGRRAPVICVASGRGGSGKTTIATAMACFAARSGLRTALLDLDLMFGNAYTMLGVEEPRDIGSILEPSVPGELSEADIVRASMRVAPGLTLWGPLGVPERAELLGKPLELLLGVLRAEADVVIVDTSTTWTDAVAAMVSSCDRCLVVGDGAVGSAESMQRLIAMIGRFGIPRTRMTCVVNRVGQRGCPGDTALRIEMKVALSSKARVADGGSNLSALAEIGRMDEAARAQTPFGQSIRRLTSQLLRELGCPVSEEPGREDAHGETSVRPRLHLPWKNVGEAA